MHCWWECKLVQPLWKTLWKFLKKLKIEIPDNLVIALLGFFFGGVAGLFLFLVLLY